MIGMPTIQLSAGLFGMASGSSQRQRGLQPYGFDGRGKRADKRGDDGRAGRNHRRRIWVCGRFHDDTLPVPTSDNRSSNAVFAC